MQETYKIENRDWAAKLLAVVVVVTMVTSTFVLFAPEASARTGEELNFGYSFKDQDSGASYSWREIHPSNGGGGTTLITYTTDAAQGPYDFADGFKFEMFGREYTKWGNSGDNGFMTLGGTAGSMWTPYHIPYASAGTAIFGGWFDGGFCSSKSPLAGVYYKLDGTAPNREFILTYQDQVHWYPSVTGCNAPGGTDGLTWQIILHEGSNEITIQWKDANGGYGSDDEWLTSGIQGKTDDGVLGLEYIYRGDPAEPDNNDVVVFSPPPPLEHDMKLKSTVIPDPVSLADPNVFGATVQNLGVNCDLEADADCTPQPETNVEVNAQIFSVAENANTYAFDPSGSDDGFVKMSAADNNALCSSDADYASANTCLQGQSKWTSAANDGKGNHNYGDDGTDDGTDGAWSSARKSSTLGGMLNDNQKIHKQKDGAAILVADKGTNSVLSINPSSHSAETVLASDTTYLRNVLDVTDDGTYYYTLSRTASTYSSTTYVCKWQMSDGAKVGCNTGSVKYGVALTNYGGEVFALQGGSTSSAYRKAIILDASDSNLAATGDTINYYSGVSAYSYAGDIDVDEDTGDMYITYRDFYGRVRAYERQSGGDYCATSSCYTQYYAYTRYHHGLDVEGGYAYTTGYYYSSYYGGLRKADTSSKAVTTLWSSYGDNYGYRKNYALGRFARFSCNRFSFIYSFSTYGC